MRQKLTDWICRRLPQPGKHQTDEAYTMIRLIVDGNLLFISSRSIPVFIPSFRMFESALSSLLEFVRNTVSGMPELQFTIDLTCPLSPSERNQVVDQ